MEEDRLMPIYQQLTPLDKNTINVKHIFIWYMFHQMTGTCFENSVFENIRDVGLFIIKEICVIKINNSDR